MQLKKSVRLSLRIQLLRAMNENQEFFPDAMGAYIYELTFAANWN